MTAKISSPLNLSFMASCLLHKPSPRIVAFTTLSPHLSTLVYRTTCSPTVDAHLGMGKQKKVAITSKNLAEEKVVSGFGRQRRKAVDAA